jgi:hypothetical protein
VNETAAAATAASTTVTKEVSSASNGGVGLSETSPSTSEVSSSSVEATAGSSFEQDELRKRRLARFTNQAEHAAGE